MTLIRSDLFLFAVSAELDEVRWVLRAAEAKPNVDDTEIARLKGLVEGLEWCEEQIRARAKSAAGPTFREIEEGVA
jgi:hypothetical protein